MSTLELSQPRYLANAEETFQAGKEIGKAAVSGLVLTLSGNLGAGKTTLTQGVAEGLEILDAVTSPTFSLVQEYLGGRLPLFHFDFYRLESATEADELGFDDFLERGGLVIVEWASLYPEVLPRNVVCLHLSVAEDGGRWLERQEQP